MKELDAVVAAIDSLGPIVELDRRWRGNPATVEEARAIRAEIQEVLDRPRCAYDDAALDLYRALTPADRALVGEEERRALIPYAVRSPRTFGERETGLGAFGWKRVHTEHGERFHLYWVG